MADANEAFLAGNLDEAQNLASEIIRLNGDIFQAYALLTVIYDQKNNVKESLRMQWLSCHLKKDTALWISCAQRFLGVGNIKKADDCFRGAIRTVPGCVEARIGKAKILSKKGKHDQAITEYKKILSKWGPHDIEVIRLLAEAYVDNREVENAKELYRETFTYLKALPEDDDQMMDWNDVSAYLALFEGQGNDYEAALKELKSLARWLLGREEQHFFDDVTSNDCEWDNNNARRVELPDFQVDEYEPETYGAGLPLELRVKMGIFRLRLSHFDEAMVRNIVLVTNRLANCFSATLRLPHLAK